MSGVVDAISGIFEGIGDAISSVVDAVGGVIEGIGETISDAVSLVGQKIEAILEDPLPTLIQIYGYMNGIPPYVTSAVITAAQGGDLEDVAKSAAIAYVSQQALSSTQIGLDISNYTSNLVAGDFTDLMMENFNLPADVAVQVAKAATASLNSSIIGGVNAAISGRSVSEGMTTGFTSGLIYSSTNSYFDTLNKDPNWGFSNAALNLMKGSTSTALNTIVSGKGDPVQAVGNYIAFATLKMGETALTIAAKDAYVNLTTDTEAAQEAQGKYTLAKAEVDAKIIAGEKLRTDIIADEEAFNQKIKDLAPIKESLDSALAENAVAIATFNEQKSLFEENKATYNNYAAKMQQDGYIASVDDGGNETYYKLTGGQYGIRDDGEGPYRAFIPDGSIKDDENNAVAGILYAPTKQSFADAANAAAIKTNAAAATSKATAEAAQKIYDDNKALIDSVKTDSEAISAKVVKFNAIKDEVVTPNGTNAAQKLKDASDAYQVKYDAWAKTKSASDTTAENYVKALAATATRDATIDALNTGAITVTGKDADGNWTLSNNMILTTGGKFVQEGEQLFTNAAGIPQKVMDFKSNDGSNVDFSQDAGRLLSETDAANICKRDFGFVPTEAELAKLVGTAYTTSPTDNINVLAGEKARSTYFAITGEDPTDEQITTSVKSGDVLNTAADMAVNILDLPPGYIMPDTSVQEKISRGQAYAANRALFGNKHIFEWTDPKTGVTGKFTTESREEKNARLAKAAKDDQNRINLMPASSVAGAGCGFFGGTPAGVENIYLGMKDNNVYVDTRTFDVMNRVTGGSLSLADDKTATNVRATGILGQMAATGAQGIGELMQSFSSGIAALTGISYDNATYNLGKTIEQWGKNKDGASVEQETKNFQKSVAEAGKEDYFTAVQTISKAAYNNPFGFISSVGKEVVQEGPALAIGAVATAFMGPMGIPAALSVRSAISASLNGLESFGSGAKETYDALRAKGVVEDVARNKALMVGGIHAAMTIPTEFIADKMLFGNFLRGITGGVKEGVTKFGSTIATNFAQEYLETYAQNATTQYVTTGEINTKKLNAESFYSGIIGAGTASSIIAPASINNLVVVAKDYAGKDVSFKELMDGTRDVNLSTLDSAATIGKSSNGGDVTLGALTAVGTDIGLTNTEIENVLPASITGYNSVVYRSADGTELTLGNIDSILKKNTSLDFTTVLDSIYTTSAADYKVVFSPSVLNGTAEFKPATDYETTAKAAGFPSFALYQQYGGDIALYNNAQNNSLATAAGFPDYATYTKYNGDLATYNTAKTDSANTLKATTAGFPDYASYTKYGGDVDAYNTAKTAEANTKKATDAGFPDYAAYTQYSGDIKAYNTATTNAANLQTATAAGFPDFASYTKFNGDIKAYNTEQTNTTNLATAKAAGFPDYENYNLYKGDINAFNTANENAANLTTAKAAGFPDYAAYTQYKGDVTAYNTAITAAANAQKATDAGFPDYATYTQYNGNKAVYTAALSDASNTALATKAGFPDFNTYTLYSGDKKAYDTALTNTANTQKATAAGFPNYAAYTQYNGDVNAYNADSAAKIAGWKDAAEQTKASAAGYTEPTAYATYVTDTANKEKATTAGFPDYTTYTQYNGDIAAYNAAKATGTVTTDSVTTAINNAIAGIQFPAGITAADVAAQVKAALAANPGLSAADVTTAITTYMQNNPGVSAADVTAAVNTATKDLVTNAALTTALSGVTTDVKTKFDTLTQGQKDIVSAYTEQGIDINKAINDAANLTADQITNVKTELNTVKTQITARVDELVLQGKTNQDATKIALAELNSGVVGLGTGFNEIKEQLRVAEEEKKKTALAAAQAAQRATSTSASARNLSNAMTLIAPAAAGLIDNSTPGFKDIGYKNTGEAKFESILSPFQEMVEENTYAAKPQPQGEQQTQQQLQQAAPVKQELDPQKDQQQGSDYFSYGRSSEIDQTLGNNPGTQMLFSKAGGLATPLFAGGGTTRHGRYAGGGLGVVNHAGKPRIDFRTGNAVTGPGDGQSDDIPAMLADGEFVFPADVVAALGNGSTKAGSDKLYDMMHSIRAHHRSAKPKDLPPPAKKSPLDYLTKTKARR